MTICCCSLAGTKACYLCKNYPHNVVPPWMNDYYDPCVDRYVTNSVKMYEEMVAYKKYLKEKQEEHKCKE